MSSNSVSDDFDDAAFDESYTDTSMFNAEDIVRSVEEVSQQRKMKKAKADRDALARRRFEDMAEEKRLREALSDWDDDLIDA